jgi:hypothetical protein
MHDEFGKSFSSILISDTRLTVMFDKTPAELLALGEDPKDIWLAICAQQGVPKERWHGKPKTKQHAD